jgi:hypothetical protein
MRSRFLSLRSNCEESKESNSPEIRPQDIMGLGPVVFRKLGRNHKRKRILSEDIQNRNVGMNPILSVSPKKSDATEPRTTAAR